MIAWRWFKILLRIVDLHFDSVCNMYDAAEQWNFCADKPAGVSAAVVMIPDRLGQITQLGTNLLAGQYPASA